VPTAVARASVQEKPRRSEAFKSILLRLGSRGDWDHVGACAPIPVGAVIPRMYLPGCRRRVRQSNALTLVPTDFPLTACRETRGCDGYHIIVDYREGCDPRHRLGRGCLL